MGQLWISHINIPFTENRQISKKKNHNQKKEALGFALGTNSIDFELTNRDNTTRLHLSTN